MDIGLIKIKMTHTVDAIGSNVANHYIFASADLALFKDLEAKVQSYQCLFSEQYGQWFHKSHTHSAGHKTNCRGTGDVGAHKLCLKRYT